MWTPQAKAIFALMRRVWMCTCAIALHSCLDMNGVSTDIIYLKSNRSAHKFSLWGKKMCLRKFYPNYIETKLQRKLSIWWLHLQPNIGQGQSFRSNYYPKNKPDWLFWSDIFPSSEAVIRSKFSETKGNLLTRKVVVFLNLYSKW